MTWPRSYRARPGHGPAALVCEVQDEGQITDPLAGRHPDSPDAESGHGLRIAHDLCDLVELRSGPWGTIVRLHVLFG